MNVMFNHLRLAGWTSKSARAAFSPVPALFSIEPARPRLRGLTGVKPATCITERLATATLPGAAAVKLSRPLMGVDALARQCNRPTSTTNVEEKNRLNKDS